VISSERTTREIVVATGPFAALPPAGCGAVERIWYDLSLEFAKHHSVRVYGRSHEALDDYIKRPHHEIFNCGMRCKNSSSLFVNLIKDFAYSAALIRRMQKCDLFIANSFWLPVLASKLRRKFPVVAYNVARMPKRQLFLYKGIDRLYAVSSAVKEVVNAQCPSLTPRTVVIGNPVKSDVLTNSCTNRKPTILYVGRVHPEKGVHLLVKAFQTVHATHPDWNLRIVGPHAADDLGGGEGYLSSLMEDAAGFPVEFTGPIFDAACLAQEYRKAEVFCYPSLAESGESFGVAPLEAMATGSLTVVSDLLCFRDFINNTSNAFVFDHRSDEPVIRLAESLLATISQSPDAKARVRENAIRTAQSYSCEKIALQYLDDIDSLCDAR